MGVEEWMRSSIEMFFREHPSPTQQDLDEHAKAIVQASSVRPVGMQGACSYTVIAGTDTIVSFRIPESPLGGRLDKLAHVIHGDVVPLATFHGVIDYSERIRIEKRFWDVFWDATKIKTVEEQEKIKYLVEQAAKLGLLLVSAFKFDEDRNHGWTDSLLKDEKVSFSGVSESPETEPIKQAGDAQAKRAEIFQKKEAENVQGKEAEDSQGKE
ncbi:Uu.00g122810.m01.CDS01 [Anthostomella pinea]|uniref:Uu.00g122810.m01.CDS01 n=1 Tax=Anthostomella pinea TaxID=933095 RepID=A0AAI8VHA8_9PEZI|nr:Uu.00g122810.m01.CDS01 [Anthostomella pinea]